MSTRLKRIADLLDLNHLTTLTPIQNLEIVNYYKNQKKKAADIA